MTVPIRALSTPPQSKMSVSPMPRADREDEIADEGSEQAEPDRNQPGHWPAHIPEDIARNEHAGHDPAEQAE
jgi:hypothetical protein